MITTRQIEPEKTMQDNLTCLKEQHDKKAHIQQLRRDLEAMNYYAASLIGVGSLDEEERLQKVLTAHQQKKRIEDLHFIIFLKIDSDLKWRASVPLKFEDRSQEIKKLENIIQTAFEKLIMIEINKVPNLASFPPGVLPLCTAYCTSPELEPNHNPSPNLLPLPR